MTLPFTGPITLGDIAAEFADAQPHSLTEFYGVATGIPVDGEISFNDFYGITAPTTYAVVPDTGSVDEGVAINFTVQTTNVTEGTVLYYQNNNTTDFASTTGSFTINSNFGNFTQTPDLDLTTEGSESFTVSIYSELTELGTPAVFLGNSTTFIDSIYIAGSNQFVMAYCDSVDASPEVLIRTVSISGTTITYGTAVSVVSSGGSVKLGYDTLQDKLLIIYYDNTNSLKGTGRVGTISGNNITLGAATTWSAGGVTELDLDFDPVNGKFLIGFRDQNNNSWCSGVVATISSTSVSFGSVRVVMASTSQYINIIYDSTNEKFAIIFQTAQAPGSGQIQAIGVMTTYIYNGTSFYLPPVGNLSSYWNLVNTENYCSFIKAIYIPTLDKIVISYTTLGTGKIIVGNVSGTNTVWGTAVNSSTSITHNNITYDFNKEKLIWFYSASSTSEIRVGTISGNNVLLESSTTTFVNGTTSWFGLSFDTLNTSALISYSDSTNNDSGTSMVYNQGSDVLGTSTVVVINDTSLTPGTQYAVLAVGNYWIPSLGSVGTPQDFYRWEWSTGSNQSTFGSLGLNSTSGAGTTNMTSMILAGAEGYTGSTNAHYKDLTSTSNSTSFGNVQAPHYIGEAASNPNVCIFCGGWWNPTNQAGPTGNTQTISYKSFSTSATNSNWGSLLVYGRRSLFATSDYNNEALTGAGDWSTARRSDTMTVDLSVASTVVNSASLGEVMYVMQAGSNSTTAYITGNYGSSPYTPRNYVKRYDYASRTMNTNYMALTVTNGGVSISDTDDVIFHGAGVNSATASQTWKKISLSSAAAEVLFGSTTFNTSDSGHGHG